MADQHDQLTDREILVKILDSNERLEKDFAELEASDAVLVWRDGLLQYIAANDICLEPNQPFRLNRGDPIEQARRS